MNCRCGKLVEFEREELGLTKCLSCAVRTPITKVKGRMIYEHKTGGQIEVTTADSFEENRKYFEPQGARSCVKNFSKKIRIT